MREDQKGSNCFGVFGAGVGVGAGAGAGAGVSAAAHACGYVSGVRR